MSRAEGTGCALCPICPCFQLWTPMTAVSAVAKLLPVHTTGWPLPALGLQRYRYRLVVDESISVGVLGQHGRGAAEEAGYAPEDVEIVGGSMSEWRACLRVQSPAPGAPCTRLAALACGGGLRSSRRPCRVWVQPALLEPATPPACSAKPCRQRSGLHRRLLRGRPRDCGPPAAQRPGLLLLRVAAPLPGHRCVRWQLP